MKDEDKIMADKFNQKGASPVKNKIPILLFFAAWLLFGTSVLHAQTSTPTPAPTDERVTLNGFEVTSSFEIGVRGVSVNGNDNKYRSDFNYRPGVRLFDSSFLLENKEKKRRFFDTLQIISSGWNADPSGFTRFNIEKVGLYRFESNVRQVSYFNNLNNHARNGHTADTRHNFGDFDLTVYPSKLFRLRFGASFSKTNGTGSITSRAYSDEFPISSRVDNGANDLRAGIDSKAFGFNLSFSFGFRRFKDKASYSTFGNPGYNSTNTTVISTFDRSYPVKGITQYALFSAQRTFARKLDFTARIMHANTDRTFGFIETITGRDNSNNIVDLDRFNINGDSTRRQTRGDLGVTYAVTGNFRISDTFTFDTFKISGDSAFAEAFYTRTAAGGARNPVFTNTFYDRVTDFERFVNTIEADYQFSDRFGFNIGYRFTKRRVELLGFTQTLPPAATPTITLINDEENNQTNTLIAGFKAKPLRNMVIFADVEHGEADNAFTRLANYNFTNLRLRTRWNFKQFAFNFSAITKDNENPSTSTAPPGNYPSGNFIANTKNRIFSVYGEWNPIAQFSLTAGYTFQRLTSETDIVINTGTLVRGLSRFYMRDHHAFFDISAQPFKRVSIFAGYQRNEDLGQGNRTAALPVLLTSYPFKLSTAESRIAIRLTKNIDWNIGYKYISYNERIQPLSVGAPQDYHANLPYVSLRIFFGGGSERR
jgi:hypothetical protein